jgi:hypothetical protein
MSHVPITINGVAYPKNKKDPPMPVTIVGYAWISGLQVGGGPVLPPEIEQPPDQPPVIWGGGNEPFPTPPIELPPPTEPPSPPEAVKPPPDGGGWAWGPNVGWIFVPGSSTPGPKRR